MSGSVAQVRKRPLFAVEQAHRWPAVYWPDSLSIWQAKRISALAMDSCHLWKGWSVS